VIEVELVRQADHAFEDYARLFKQRYGTTPISVSPAIDKTIIKDFVRLYGYNRTVSLLHQFFKMDGERNWFATKAHSLQVFKNSINEINTKIPQTENSLVPQTKGRGVKIKAQFYCDNHSCRKPFLLEGYGDEIDRPHYCGDCTNS
jgi:hypothetical protein